MSKLSVLIRSAKHRLGMWALRDTGLTPIREILPEDITIASYPKSGVTWLQNLLAGARYGIQPIHTPNAVIQSLIPTVELGPYFVRSQTPTFFKYHSLPERHHRRVINLVRDGRDVVVSYRHHREAATGEPFAYTEIVGPEARPWPCKWHEHVQRWMDNPFDAEILRVRYEDLVEDPVRQLGRICSFAGLERTTEQLQAAVDNAVLQKLRKQEQQFGGSSCLPGTTFFRRGEIGSHRDELPEEILQAFVDESRDALSRCGYPVAPADAEAPQAA